ncbi:MAG: bactofilin family protein [Thiobacillus sp.]
MLKNFMQPGTGTGSNSSGVDAARMVHSGYPSKPTDSIRTPDAPKQDTAQPRKAGPNDEGSKLIVGPNITLKGSEITDCDILLVEGRVEASMNSRDIRIAESGIFSGKAEIDVAEVRGQFEGELTARKRLVIYATGRVSGVIRYGAMMVEEGGVISGNVAMLEDAGDVAPATETAEPAAEAEPAPEAAAEKKTDLEEILFHSTVARAGLAKRRA